jgi:hypothetical protein
MDRQDFRYVTRHRFLPHSLLNHTDTTTPWFGATRYEKEEDAIADARKSAEFSVRDGIQVEVIKEVVVWKFSNDGFVGTWFKSSASENPVKIKIEASPEPENPPTMEEVVYRLFTEKKKTRKEISVIVALSYNTVCKIIREERRTRGSVAVNSNA